MRTIHINQSKLLFEYTNEDQHAIRHNIQPKSNKMFHRVKHVKFYFEGGTTWCKKKHGGKSFLMKLMEIYTKDVIEAFVSFPNIYEMNIYIINALKSLPMCVLENIEKDARGNILKDSSVDYEVVKRGGNQKVLHIDMAQPWPHVCVFRQLKAYNSSNPHTYIVLQRVGTTMEHANQCYEEHLDDDMLLPVRDVMCGRIRGVSVKRETHWDMKGCEIDQTVPENIGETCFFLIALDDLKKASVSILESHTYSPSCSFQSFASTVTTVEIMESLQKIPVITSQMINVVMSAMYTNSEKKISGK